MFVCLLLLDVDSSSKFATNILQHSDIIDDVVDDVNLSSCCNQNHHHRKTSDYSKHQATSHHHHHHHYQCSAADGAAGYHGNCEDGEGTCQHADWWKHKVTCH